MISSDSKATLYSAIVVVESLGHAIGDPAMQQIFAASLQLPKFWHALPFFVAAVSMVSSEHHETKTEQGALYSRCIINKLLEAQSS